MTARLGLDTTLAPAKVAAAWRAVPADSLVAAVNATRALLEGPPPTSSIRAVVDGWVLPAALDVAVAQGAVARVPVLLGTNEDEGEPAIRETPLRDAEALRGALRTWYGDTAGTLAGAYGLADTSDVLTMLRRISGDARYGAPARALARLLAARGVPVYRYHFTGVGRSATGASSAFHAAEVPFVFGTAKRAGGGDAPLFADAMRDYWVAFATSGDPNSAPATGRWPHWPAYDARTDPYLELGREIVARRGLREAEYDAHDALARTRGGVRP
jgi:para-nitrobenzyl esterase